MVAAGVNGLRLKLVRCSVWSVLMLSVSGAAVVVMLMSGRVSWSPAERG